MGQQPSAAAARRGAPKTVAWKGLVAFLLAAPSAAVPLPDVLLWLACLCILHPSPPACGGLGLPTLASAGFPAFASVLCILLPCPTTHLVEPCIASPVSCCACDALTGCDCMCCRGATSDLMLPCCLQLLRCYAFCDGVDLPLSREAGFWGLPAVPLPYPVSVLAM